MTFWSEADLRFLCDCWNLNIQLWHEPFHSIFGYKSWTFYVGFFNSGTARVCFAFGRFKESAHRRLYLFTKCTDDIVQVKLKLLFCPSHHKLTLFDVQFTYNNHAWFWQSQVDEICIKCFPYKEHQKVCVPAIPFVCSKFRLKDGMNFVFSLKYCRPLCQTDYFMWIRYFSLSGFCRSGVLFSVLQMHFLCNLIKRWNGGDFSFSWREMVYILCREFWFQLQLAGNGVHIM
jgi:hypothetical protein